MIATAVQPASHLTGFDESEQQMQQKVRQFAERVLRPLVQQMDAEARIPRSLISELFDLGMMGIEIPKAFGGLGMPFFHTVLAVQEIARVDPAVAVLVDVQNALVNTALLRWGSAEQKQQYLPQLSRIFVGAYAMSEELAGSDAFALSTRAEKSGDSYVLNGSKKWTTNGAEAELFLVFANVKLPNNAPGITAFLVEKRFDGVVVGQRANKLGIRASSTCELALHNVRVPAANVLGPVGAGHRVAVETLNEGRVGIAAQMLGLAQGAFEAALAYSKQRQQFGQPIVNFQAVQFQLADLSTRIEAARLLVYNAARMKENGADGVERFRSAAMAKYFASQVAEHVASKSLEIFGGNGYLTEFPAEKYFRDAKIGSIYEGTSNMQLRTIATTLIRS